MIVIVTITTPRQVDAGSARSVVRNTERMSSREQNTAANPPASRQSTVASPPPSQQIASALKRERLRAGLTLSEVARRDIYFIQAEPGEPRESLPHPQGTIEHVILGRGGARIEVLGQSYELTVGDYLTHPGDHPHRFTALEPGTNAVFVVESS